MCCDNGGMARARWERYTRETRVKKTASFSFVLSLSSVSFSSRYLSPYISNHAHIHVCLSLSVTVLPSSHCRSLDFRLLMFSLFSSHSSLKMAT